MANILYGVNGEGSGHSTRARPVISHLESAGHTVHVASFDRGLANLQADFDVTEIFGLRLAYVNNRVRVRRTLARSIFGARKIAHSLASLAAMAQTWAIDLVITDFEPISSRVRRPPGFPSNSKNKPHGTTNTQSTHPAK